MLDTLSRPGERAAFPLAVLHEALSQDHALIEGILAYRRHPWKREVPPVPTVWRDGQSTLLDYGGDGPVLLVVPSLVNRSHVLDLMADHSMLRWLAANGTHPVLLDWGAPDAAERRFSLSDYVAGRLERAMTAIGEPVILTGYCMGGLLAAAAALRCPDQVRALSLLATPWDFHAPDPGRAQQAAGLLPLLEPLLAIDHALPIDALQTLFAMLDPWGIATKYRAFRRLDPDSARARMFVALEDWLNDGVALAEPVARECLGGWYGANTPHHGAWRIAGEPVNPERIACPAFVALPARDRIVPPESADALARAIPNAIRHTPASGHVGMVAAMGAEQALWRPLRDWVVSLDHRT